MKLEMQENIKVEFTYAELMSLVGKFLIGADIIADINPNNTTRHYLIGLFTNLYTENDSKSVSGKLEKALALYSDDNKNEK